MTAEVGCFRGSGAFLQQLCRWRPSAWAATGES
ncbi:hypothetical protein FOXYSP1_11205 [Fusarium oxysporum f. sp. phaseoli]